MYTTLVKEINRLYYEAKAEDYDVMHPEITMGDVEWWNTFGRKFVKPLSDSKNISLLDIGSGTGFVANEILKYIGREDTFFCYDLSIKMLFEARQKLEKTSLSRKNFLAGDAESLPFKDLSFDVITVNSVLHHLPDYPLLLNEINRVLKKGGVFAVAHELNSDFFKSKLLCVMASLYKLMGGGIKIADPIQKEVNAQLKEKKLIERDLSKDEIMRLVEYHSPIEQDDIFIDITKGLSPSELIAEYFSEYEVLEMKAYSTFFHRPFLEKNKFFQSGLRFLGNLFLRGKGTLFRFILKKP